MSANRPLVCKSQPTPIDNQVIVLFVYNDTYIINSFNVCFCCVNVFILGVSFHHPVLKFSSSCVDSDRMLLIDPNQVNSLCDYISFFKNPRNGQSENSSDGTHEESTSTNHAKEIHRSHTINLQSTLIYLLLFISPLWVGAELSKTTALTSSAPISRPKKIFSLPKQLGSMSP